MLALSASTHTHTHSHTPITGGFRCCHCAFRAGLVLRSHMDRVGAVSHGSGRCFLVTCRRATPGQPASSRPAADQQPASSLLCCHTHSGREGHVETCTWTLFLLSSSDFIALTLCRSARESSCPTHHPPPSHHHLHLHLNSTELTPAGSKTCSAALQMRRGGFEAPVLEFQLN